MGSIWAKWTLSGQSWHYPTVELGKIGQSGHYLGQVGTIQGWIWAKFGKVGTICAKWALSKVDKGQKWPILDTVVTFQGLTRGKVAHPRYRCHFSRVGWHYPRVDKGQKWPILDTFVTFQGLTRTIQGWIRAKSGQSSILLGGLIPLLSSPASLHSAFQLVA